MLVQEEEKKEEIKLLPEDFYILFTRVNNFNCHVDCSANVDEDEQRGKLKEYLKILTKSTGVDFAMLKQRIRAESTDLNHFFTVL